jgi:Heavy metal associated domain 2
VTERGSSPDLKVSREALQLVHHHPGRLRVRADKFRVDEETVRLVREGLDRFRGVTRTEHNLRTGSILIEYQPGVAEPEAILAFVADTADLDRYAPRIAPPVEPGLIAIEAVREINAISLELTGKRMDLRTLVPAGLAALGAYAFLEQRGERLPRWDNLLYWSYNMFTLLHRREIEGERPLSRSGGAPTPPVPPPPPRRAPGDEGGPVSPRRGPRERP